MGLNNSPYKTRVFVPNSLIEREKLKINYQPKEWEGYDKNGVPFKITEIKESDYSQVAKIFAYMFPELIMGACDFFTKENKIRDIVKDTGMKFIVAKYEKNPVGALGMYFDQFSMSGDISFIVVSGNYGNRGVASLLFEHSLDLIKDSGALRATVECESWDAKIQHLARKHGFRYIGYMHKYLNSLPINPERGVLKFPLEGDLENPFNIDPNNPDLKYIYYGKVMLYEKFINDGEELVQQSYVTYDNKKNAFITKKSF